MKHSSASLLIALCAMLTTACADDDAFSPAPTPVDPSVRDSLSLSVPSGGFRAKTCSVLNLEPSMANSGSYSYRWTIGDSLIGDSLHLNFIALEEGTYSLRLTAISSDTVYSAIETNIIVTPPAAPYSPYITSVPSYLPAPGQFVNALPQYEEGDTQEDMNRKALEAIGNNNRGMITLGMFGGYVVCGFDHTIVNIPGKRDFRILGNAFYASANPNPASAPGGSCEPGIVEVAYDSNGNGLPDESEWYELSGSEYGSESTRHEYYITYHRTPTDHKPTPDLSASSTDTTYIQWTDNDEKSGYLRKLSFHSQNYYPQWVKEESLSFSGTRLTPNGKDESGEGTYWVLYAYPWGYADNRPNTEDGSAFDIAWAVDRNGKKVKLPGIDFVRIYTGVNQQCGWLGETSTEVSGITDLHISNKKTNQ